MNSVLALKSYSTWKKGGGNGVWRFGGTDKSPTSSIDVVPKNSEPATNSLTRTSSTCDSFCLELSSSDDPSNETVRDLFILLFLYFLLLS